MRLLDLFSGIGGFSLGLERAGFKTVAFCEIDPFCRAVLKKHWPDVPCYNDVTTLTAAGLAADGIIGPLADSERNDVAWGRHSGGNQQDSKCLQQNTKIDAICGGFPCQDISKAGKGAGITGSCSGLWTEYARIIGELRPRYVIVENVAALLNRGMERVLGDLAALGYDAEWHCIPASAVGAPHQRDRVWIVAYPQQPGEGRRGISGPGENKTTVGSGAPSQSLGTGQDVADANIPRLEGRLAAILCECAEQGFAWAGGFQGWDEAKWFAQSGMGRISNGTANRVDRLRSLGNAIVPQIAEIIGRAILQ